MHWFAHLVRWCLSDKPNELSNKNQTNKVPTYVSCPDWGGRGSFVLVFDIFCIEWEQCEKLGENSQKPKNKTMSAVLTLGGMTFFSWVFALVEFSRVRTVCKSIFVQVDLRSKLEMVSFDWILYLVLSLFKCLLTCKNTSIGRKSSETFKLT